MCVGENSKICRERQEQAEETVLIQVKTNSECGVSLDKTDTSKPPKLHIVGVCVYFLSG